MEFAIMLPATLFMVLGVLQFAQMFLTYRHLMGAATSGARTGAVQNSTVSEVQAAVNTYLGATDIGSNFQATITGVGTAATGDTLVSVAVRHNFPLFIKIPGIGWDSGTVPLTSTVTMRHE